MGMFTLEEKQEILRLHKEENKTQTEIARIKGVHIQTIMRVLNGFGVFSKTGRRKLPEVSERKCTICGEVKPLSAFHTHKNCPCGKEYRCRTCMNIKHEDRRMRKFYGISLQQYEERLKSQNGLCAICCKGEATIDPRNGKPRKLSVDHDHERNIVRGLLCQKCNVSLGNFDDKIDLLEKAIAYLKSKGVT